MTLELDPRSDDGLAPDVPVDWEDWDYSDVADVLVDDPSWCLLSGEVPRPPTADDSRSGLDADPEAFSGADAIDFLIELQRVQSRLAALETRVLVSAATAHIDANDRSPSSTPKPRRQRAKAALDVHIYPDEDGLAALLARMPIEEAVRAHAAIFARARATHAECDATLGRLRVTALLEACLARSPPWSSRRSR
jgi:hypothetical protein